MTGGHPRSGGLVLAFDGVADRDGGRGAARDRAGGRLGRAAGDRGGRRVLRPPARRPGRRATRPAPRSARSPTSCTRRRQDLLVVRDADGREQLVPFVRRSCRPSTCRAAGSWSTRRRGCSTCERARCGRRLTIFPEYLDAAAGLAPGQGGRARPARRARARPARLDLRPAPDRRRHPVRRRRRDGDAARAVGRWRWTRSCPPGGRHGWSCRPRRAAVHPGSWPQELADEPWLVFACGRYEGIDQRVVD